MISIFAVFSKKSLILDFNFNIFFLSLRKGQVLILVVYMLWKRKKKEKKSTMTQYSKT